MALFHEASADLPPLPRVIAKREAGVTPAILDWFRTNYVGSAAIEIKVTERKYISEHAVLPHQKLALLAASSSQGLCHKISDESRRRQPFDAFLLKGVRGFVVAVFLHKDVRMALVIDIHKWKGADSSTPSEFSFPI